MKIKIKKENIGWRLDKFLTQNLSDFSRSQIQKMIKNGLVKVNDKLVAPHYFLKENDEIKIIKDKPKVKNTKKNKSINFKIKVVAETEDYLVINKPVGLLVHPNGVHKEETLIDWLISQYLPIKNVYDRENKIGPTRPGIVHRLDRDVSGLMVVAKTQAMFEYLKNQFKTGQIKKEYLTLAHGQIDLGEGEIKRSIARSKETGRMVARGSNQEPGKTAITQFTIIKRFKNYTFLRVKLITGRTHQIRVHLRSIGHSVAGDTLYATRNIKHKKIKEALDQIFLCAVQLGFYDLKQNWQEFEIKLPVSLTKFLKGLR